MSPQQTQMLPEVIRQFDFSEGILGGRSDLGIPTTSRRLGRRAYIRHVRLANNAIFRPARAIKVRTGSRDISTAMMTGIPQSVGKFYNTGGNRVFVHEITGVGTGKLEEAQGSAYVTQTAPYSLTDQNMTFVQINGVLVATQSGGTQPPFFYYQGAGTTWLTSVLPAPAQAPTGALANGGNLTNGTTYYYRVRWRYTNGSSLSSPVSAGFQATSALDQVSVGNLTPTAQGGSPRADYLGYTLERNKTGGDATGPWYTVIDGTATPYVDAAADASLFTFTRETNHGSPVHVDGVVAHRNRLWGWEGSNLHMSQLIGDPTEATGIFNWIGDNIYLVAKDDGDFIETCIVQHDRLVIFKRRSIWALEGDAPESFRLRGIFQGSGACGPRAVGVTGTVLWFDSGDGGFFEIRGDRVIPIGWTQIGHYLDARDLSHQSAAVVTPYLGDYIIFWYTASGGSVNGDQLVYDLRFGNWTHFAGDATTGWVATDAFVQKDELDFSRATLIFSDPNSQRGNLSITAANNTARIIIGANTINMTLTIQNAPPATIAQDLQAKTRTAYNAITANHNGWYVNYGFQIVGTYNDSMIVNYGGFSPSIFMLPGTYDAPELAALVQTALQNLVTTYFPFSGDVFSVVYAAGTFTVALTTTGGRTFGFQPSFTNISLATVMGFLPVTQALATSHASDFTVFKDRVAICWKGDPSGTFPNVTYKFSDLVNFSSAATLGYAIADVGPPGKWAVAGTVVGYGYHLWAGFTGTVDRAAADGSGGVPIQFMFESPKIDEGTPNQYKDFERLEAYIDAVGATLTASFDFDDDAPPTTVNFQSAVGSALWNAFNWNDGTLWAIPQRSLVTRGLPAGSIARRYSVRFTSSLTVACSVPGYVVNALLTPEYRFS